MSKGLHVGGLLLDVASSAMLFRAGGDLGASDVAAGILFGGVLLLEAYHLADLFFEDSMNFEEVVFAREDARA